MRTLLKVLFYGFLGLVVAVPAMILLAVIGAPVLAILGVLALPVLIVLAIVGLPFILLFALAAGVLGVLVGLGVLAIKLAIFVVLPVMFVVWLFKHFTGHDQYEHTHEWA